MIKQELFDFGHDLSPKYWLSPFRSSSKKYAIIMCVLHYFPGILFGLTHFHIYVSVSGVSIPSPTFNMLNMHGSILFEEAVFFGIPCYTIKNRYIRLIIGTLWALVHPFTTISSGSLDFAVMLPLLPMIVFHIRAWSSEKSWLSISSHSVWDIIGFYFICLSLSPCPFISLGITELSVSFSIMAISISLLVITYLLRRRKIRSNEMFTI